MGYDQESCEGGSERDDLPPENIQKLFWSKVKKSRGRGCWEWQGVIGTGGYGSFRYEGKSYIAHRLSWELTHKLKIGSLFILHKCDNPPCVNPKHLVPGTHIDNMRDRDQKGRQPKGPEQVKRSRIHAGGKKKAEKVSKYRGVYWEKREQKWRAQARIQGSKRHLGYFQTEEEAKEAYDKAIAMF